jgi:hypothetical protein
VEEEALTPDTVPLSINTPVDKVLAEVHLATRPFVPLPVTWLLPKMVEVEVHWYPVAVDMRKLPAEPAALPES